MNVTRFFYILTILLIATSGLAQVDPFGEIDRVYIDSLEAGVGRDIPVRFWLRNDEPLGAISVPITYDPTKLSLKDISFSDSRAEYLSTKLTTPADFSSANGHFLVAFLQISEDPVPAGDGLLFTALFTVADSAAPGSVILIDTLFYPPGGELLLGEATTAASIYPEFVAGKILVSVHNRPPVFSVLPDQNILEGDSLHLTITVTDPDNDDINLALTAKPMGANFTDNGDGTATLSWAPDYVGPGSADGSPFRVSFWASDGDLAAEQELLVNVVNTNRSPEITDPGTIAIEAGETMAFTLRAFDPDFDAVSWTWLDLPEGATFDGGNPGQFSWSASLTDTGSFAMLFVASDTRGLSDTLNLSATVTAVELYTISLDTVTGFPGEDVEFAITLDNKFPITSFDLLFNYDVSVLSLLSLSNVGTRTEGWEYFSVTENDDDIAGNLRIIGVADQGAGVLPLEVGDGPIAICNFHISGNLAYSGLSVPVAFRFMDQPTNNDNTLADSLGTRIEQEEIVYNNGSVLIHDVGQIRIGDINLNGISAEIGDVILFTNYFINPFLYPFNVLQYANSDVNGDGIVATVSDLVAIINWLVNGVPPSAGKVGDDQNDVALVSAEFSSGRTDVRYDAPVEVGAVFLVFESTNPNASWDIVNAQEQMILDAQADGNELKILIYSLDNQFMPAGVQDLITVSGDETLQLKTVEFGSATGEFIPAELASAIGALPTDYSLAQNYPNPFNPETKIEFSLPQTSAVELTIYNVLGQEVKALTTGEYPAGTHTLTWNGTDDSGQSVASGVYLYRLQAGEVLFTRKMMLLK